MELVPLFGLEQSRNGVSSGQPDGGQSASTGQEVRHKPHTLRWHTRFRSSRFGMDTLLTVYWRACARAQGCVTMCPIRSSYWVEILIQWEAGTPDFDETAIRILSVGPSAGIAREGAAPTYLRRSIQFQRNLLMGCCADRSLTEVVRLGLCIVEETSHTFEGKPWVGLHPQSQS